MGFSARMMRSYSCKSSGFWSSKWDQVRLHRVWQGSSDVPRGDADKAREGGGSRTPGSPGPWLHTRRSCASLEVISKPLSELSGGRKPWFLRGPREEYRGPRQFREIASSSQVAKEYQPSPVAT